MLERYSRSLGTYKSSGCEVETVEILKYRNQQGNLLKSIGNLPSIHHE